ncbi:hypothetical protein MTO96_000308 [Rhipicephalus appendiculatus]
MKNPVHFGTDLRIKLSYKCSPFFTLPACHALTCESCSVECLLHPEKYASALLKCWINCNQQDCLPVAEIRGTESEAVPGSFNVAQAQSPMAISDPTVMHHVSREGRVDSSFHCSLPVNSKLAVGTKRCEWFSSVCCYGKMFSASMHPTQMLKKHQCFEYMPHALYSPDLSRNMFYTFTPCRLRDKWWEVHSQYNTHAQVFFSFSCGIHRSSFAHIHNHETVVGRAEGVIVEE